jgi:Zn ribbon nucleic-acid-binding protein
MSHFADRAASAFDLDPDHVGTVSFGLIRCPDCKVKREFVSYDESQRSPEHAECFVCGYRYGMITVFTTDPVTQRMRVEHKSALPAAIVAEARREMHKEFARALFQAEVPLHQIMPALPNIGRTYQVTDKRAMVESMRAAGMTEEQILNACGTDD